MDRGRFLELQPWCAPCSVDLARCTLLVGEAFCCFHAKGAICFFAPGAHNRDPSQMDLAMYIRTSDSGPPSLLFELDKQAYLVDHTKIENISSPAPEGRNAGGKSTATPPSAIFHFSNLSMRFWASPNMTRSSAIEKLNTAVSNLNSYLTATPPAMTVDASVKREAISAVQAKEQLQHKRKRFQSFLELLTSEMDTEMPQCCLVAALTGMTDDCHHKHASSTTDVAPSHAAAQKRRRDESGDVEGSLQQQPPQQESNAASAAIHLADSALSSYSATQIVEALRKERVKLEQSIAETLDELYPAAQKLVPAWTTPTTPQTPWKPATPARQPSSENRDNYLQRLEIDLNTLNDIAEHQYFIHCLPRVHGQVAQEDRHR